MCLFLPGLIGSGKVQLSALSQTYLRTSSLTRRCQTNQELASNRICWRWVHWFNSCGMHPIGQWSSVHSADGNSSQNKFIGQNKLLLINAFGMHPIGQWSLVHLEDRESSQKKFIGQNKLLILLANSTVFQQGLAATTSLFWRSCYLETIYVKLFFPIRSFICSFDVLKYLKFI